jgi:hypothetical protein
MRCMLYRSARSLTHKCSHHDKVLIDGVGEDGYHLREWMKYGLARKVRRRRHTTQVKQYLGSPSDTHMQWLTGCAPRMCRR